MNEDNLTYREAETEVFPNRTSALLRESVPPLVYHPAPTPDQEHVANGGRGLTQMFGLHFSSAVLTIIVDLMVFGGDVISGGMLLPVGIVLAVVLGFIVYRIQRHMYGDDHNAALTKALIVGLLTAIPVPVTPFVAIPSGVIGLANAIGRRFKS